ncbi:hypothetical protein FRC16_011089 [Serendipita sp. 398]|nr:hypothetical protein FRC16_011089 [Serendipita sp. 398]
MITQEENNLQTSTDALRRRAYDGGNFLERGNTVRCAGWTHLGINVAVTIEHVL